MVIGEQLRRIVGELKKSGNDNPYFEAHLILRRVLGLSPIDLVLSGDREIGAEELLKTEEYMKRRVKKEPLQYILQSQEFMGLDFYVDENVLIPRQDTEALVEHILEHFGGKALSGIDFGTGSGCIAVSIAKINQKAFMRAVDISDGALEIAKRNAAKNGVSDRVSIEKADIFSYDSYGKYDLIASNPPYIRSADIDGLQEEVRGFEPIGALDGGESGLLYYERITSIAPKLLRKNAMLAFEVGYDQADAVKKMLENNFENIRVIKDLCGVDRVVSGLYKG